MKRVLLGLLIAAGILIAGLSGLCSLMLLGESADSEGVMMVLLVGGLPFGMGVMLAVTGVVLLRRAKADQRGDDNDTF